MNDGSASLEGAKTRAPAARKASAAKSVRANGAPTRPTKRRRSPEEVQARILAAAVAEFAEHSFSGARIDRISKRAKTVDRMLYYYFGSKERLYQAVLEHVYAELIAAQRSFDMDERDPVQGMRQLIRHSWEHYLHHPELVRLVVTENLLRAKYLKKSTKIKGTLLPLIERIQEVLEAGQKKGVFRQDADPQSMLMTVMSLGFFYVANQYTTSRWLDADLMEAGRLNAWGDHICDVVMDHLERIR
ncbi:TetR family transcriptional regulator [Ramlibacter sp. 2FC]|uniref:TetR family transcriptional regulator n=1 Tax=Ramlibacter sp. 2FC TaxID=2502188 RepID=UPI00148563F5|nr:TetR family transcriptional regulator [Ramlibacter sp. 2FC]